MIKNFNYTKEQAENLYFEAQSLTDDQQINSWVSPWPGYMSGMDSCKKNSPTSIVCPIPTGQQGSIAPMFINTTTFDAYIETKDSKLYPNILAYPTKDKFIAKRFENSTLGFGITLFPNEDGSYNRLLSSPDLAASMFTRLFWMEGSSLNHFQKFSDERSVTGGRIITWKIDWDGKQNNIYPTFVPKPVINATNQTAAV